MSSDYPQPSMRSSPRMGRWMQRYRVVQQLMLIMMMMIDVDDDDDDDDLNLCYRS